MELTQRQLNIIDIVKENEPITGEEIAGRLELTRAAIRPDLSILTQSKILHARPKVGYFFGDVRGVGRSVSSIKEEKVYDVMSIPVIMDENESVYAALVKIFLEDVGTIFITSNGSLSGVISRKDLLKCCVGGVDIQKLPVTMAMSRMPNIVYVDKNDPIAVAVHKILTHQIDSLPVVEEDEEGRIKILGRFSKTNATKLLMKILGE